ncbi:TetR/AcrR family transcriptional regulator [Aliirhizobium smilacinae]|uniref:TetR/AcrR family transcriptional regulator n=1 Tax=Aliirhizobium smilacinae TaxID=1395944 RepID=A0A5C4XL94_9HYPH|nr:TetR/AcrR family transcriptional regulator [Rhizobium smilacinae]TNM63969.1 TetR/AcrR family transcriptional regulator [Rhizobium smilacinae]
MSEKRPSRRKNDPERTKADILDVATEEFATHGLAGGRVDAIAEKTRTSKRMIYYYFGSKEDLYLAALERSYRQIRTLEADLQLDDLSAEEALRVLISETFDYDEAHPDFIRLVSSENINCAVHMRRSETLRDLNISIVQTLERIVARGVREGVFLRQTDAIDVHMLISAFCFFRVSNRYTFGAIFRRDLSETQLMARHKQMISDAVVSYLKTPEDKSPGA